MWTHVSDVLSDLAYGNGAQILALVMDWDLSEVPSVDAIKRTQDRFLSRPPPIIVIAQYEEGVSLGNIILEDTAVASVEPLCSGFPRKPQINPVKSYDITNIHNLSDLALERFGFHIRHGSHDSLECIYFNTSLVHLYTDVFNANLFDSVHQSSFFAVCAALKITLIHELAHSLVTAKQVGHSSHLYIIS